MKIVILALVVGLLVMLAVGTGLYSAPSDSGIANNPSSATPDYLSEIRTIEKPDDFELMMRELQSGYVDICALNKNYYLQPEFYEDSWAIGEKRYYEDHDYSRWVVHGHGAYPANPHIVFKTDIPGEWIRFCTFYRPGWGAETYQGIKLVPEHSEYFDVVVEPNEFLMVPMFPVIQKDWVHKLNITVKIAQTPKKGTYTIPVNAVNPSGDNSFDWFWEVFRKDISPDQYGMLEECKQQQSETGNLNMECEKWIQTARRNKYIEAGNIQVGARLVITIEVV